MNNKHIFLTGYIKKWREDYYYLTIKEFLRANGRGYEEMKKIERIREKKKKDEEKLELNVKIC